MENKLNITITQPHLYDCLYTLLKQIYGSDANFKEGQYEAMEATLYKKRTLVVQKTGWGKSLVYFMCAKALKSSNLGTTFVISPLLVLMENQMVSAEKMGLICRYLNGGNKKEHDSIIDELKQNTADLVFITPETLFGKIQNSLKDIQISLFVIDEAHCISDWGHDFRLNYGNLYKILAFLPENVRVLGTTATANNRVIVDLQKQLGDNVFVSKGSLMRNNLYIQILNLPNVVGRYGWILENINKLDGSGIIYCLTQRDCETLALFLQANGVSAKSYYSRKEEEEYLNSIAEQEFLHNQIKVIVATIKLGMGYDKGDVAFVIHFQTPMSVVTYYQQIGRAGRNIPMANTFLMTGSEDKDIQNSFIQNAFPTEYEYTQILDFIFNNTDNGVTLGEITANSNIRLNRIKKVLMFLENDGYIVKQGSSYHSTAKEFVYDKQKYEEITHTREEEQLEMNEYINTKTCYNKYIVNCLDDNTEENCGVCSNCMGQNKFSEEVSPEYTEQVIKFLERITIAILPRKRWAKTTITSATAIQHINCQGICLSKYGVYEYGGLVKHDKYSGEDRFCDKLLDKSVSVLREFMVGKDINALTFVPSSRSNIVKDFAERLANALGILCLDVLYKAETETEAKPQKSMENSSYQCQNAQQSFRIKDDIPVYQNILLIDDIIDSKWTLTICGDLLGSKGVTGDINVYPFALADSSNIEE